MERESVGVLLMARGGLDTLEHIEPFLLQIRRGRPPAPELVAEMTERYRQIGGRSPLLDITTAQAQALEGRLSTASRRYQVVVGMLHWHPFIHETLPALAADSSRIVALALAPHYSKMSVGAYIAEVEKAKTALSSSPEILYVQSWATHPLFLLAVVRKIEEALARLPDSVRDGTILVFTAHSLPERIVQEGDPYAAELASTVQGVVALLETPQPWRFAYQSAGRTPDPWLGPSLEAVLEGLVAEGHPSVLIVPIGFVSDHVEVLYDIDIEARRLAAARGMRLERTDSLNTTPLFIEALAMIVQEHLGGDDEEEG